MMPRTKPRASSMLGKYFTTELYLKPYQSFLIRRRNVCFKMAVIGRSTGLVYDNLRWWCGGRVEINKE
jgi:hypothetical protein